MPPAKGAGPHAGDAAPRGWDHARGLPVGGQFQQPAADSRRPPRPGLGSATMPVLDSYAIGSCFRFTIARANWWPMPAAASMVPSRGTCSRQTSASRRWSLISIVPWGETARWAIVVEGFFDCLRVHQAGFRNVVALMGASLSEVQEKLLLERFARRATGQPAVGGAVVGKSLADQGGGAKRWATRPTVERGNRMDSVRGERRSWSMR